MNYPKATSSNIYWGVRNLVEKGRRRIDITSSTCMRVRDGCSDFLVYHRTYGEEMFTLRVFHHDGCVLPEKHVDTIFRIMRTHKSYTLTIDWTFPMDREFSVIESSGSNPELEKSYKDNDEGTEISISMRHPHKCYDKHLNPSGFSVVGSATIGYIESSSILASFVIFIRSKTKIAPYCLELMTKYVIEGLCDAGLFMESEKIHHTINRIRRRGEWDD